MFQSEYSGWRETSICPIHLMFATPIQPGTIEPGRESVVGRQRLAVHLQGDERVVERLRDRDRPAHVAVVDSACDDVAVEPVRHDVDCVGGDPGAVEDLGERGRRASVATPIAPSPHCVPAAGVPCWEPKKERPLPAHSMNDTISFCGQGLELRVGERDRRSLQPVPKTRSDQVAGSMIGVPVWSRTKKRSFGVV